MLNRGTRGAAEWNDGIRTANQERLSLNIIGANILHGLDVHSSVIIQRTFATIILNKLHFFFSPLNPNTM
jgi:hypothetical protein